MKLLYNYIFLEFLTLLNLHELTPFFSPSLLRKEGEDSEEQSIVTPLFAKQRGGRGGEFMGKVILFGAISSYTKGLLINILIITTFLLSCTEKKDSEIICRIEKNLISIRNANTTFSIDNSIRLEISFTKDNENFNLTGGESKISFVSLTDTAGNSLSFTRKSARVTENQ